MVKNLHKPIHTTKINQHNFSTQLSRISSSSQLRNNYHKSARLNWKANRARQKPFGGKIHHAQSITQGNRPLRNRSGTWHRRKAFERDLAVASKVEMSVIEGSKVSTNQKWKGWLVKGGLQRCLFWSAILFVGYFLVMNVVTVWVILECEFFFAD